MDWDEEEEEEDSVEEEEYEEEDEEEEDEEELLARIERAFRTERARIRACEDLHELRAMRADHQSLVTNRNAAPAARIRSRDLVELVDDRVTDLKAKRLVARGR